MVIKIPSLQNVNWLIFLLALIPTTFFYGPNLSNQNARLSAIYAFVERDPSLPAFSIDRFMYQQGDYVNTIDWTYHDGHFFSNKSPGEIILGIIPYSIIYNLEIQLGINIEQPGVAFLNAYLINFFVSALTFALSAVCFRSILIGLEIPVKRASLVTLAYIFASPLIAYNQTLWGLSTATSFLVFSLFYLKKDRYHPILSGGFLGLALLTEYLAIIVVASILIYALIIFGKKAFPILFGFLPITSILFFYQLMCFGSAFKTAKSNVHPAFEEADLLFGFFGFPSFEVIYLLLGSLQKGLFLMMPLYIFSLVGLCYWIKRNRRDPLLWISIFNIIAYILFISTFNGWHGGATTFPRYLIPSLIFWILPLKECPNVYRSAILILGLISSFNAFILASISPISPDFHPNPLYDFSYKLFFDGNLSPIKYPIRLQGLDPNFTSYQHLSSGNLGQLLGLSGYLSLLPLIIILSILFFLLFRSTNVKN